MRDGVGGKKVQVIIESVYSYFQVCVCSSIRTMVSFGSHECHLQYSMGSALLRALSSRKVHLKIEIIHTTLVNPLTLENTLSETILDYSISSTEYCEYNKIATYFIYLCIWYQIEQLSSITFPSAGNV